MKRFLSTIILISALAFSFGWAPLVFACTCYDDDKAVSVDGTEACVALCGEDTATETEDGVCSCSTTSQTLNCDSLCTDNGYTAAPATDSSSTGSSQEAEYISPSLQVDIPTVQFSEVLKEGGNLRINWLGEYVGGVYQYLLGIGALLATIMIMIGGLQYTLASGSGNTAKAKKRITDAVIGLVLLFCVYLILWIVNPRLTLFTSVELLEVDAIELDLATSGDEGSQSFGSVSRDVCDKIVEQAQDDGECTATQRLQSPTGSKPGCSNHHWFDGGAEGDWQKIHSLDYGAAWDSGIKAPFDGTLEYIKSTTTSNRCGNVIRLTGTGDAAGMKVTICHAKDFVNDSGTKATEAKQGDIIGHLGGRCCEGETPPENWAAAKRGWCNVSYSAGEKCTNPNTRENCKCQEVEQAGNTSGPHVHITWKGTAGALLACLDY